MMDINKKLKQKHKKKARNKKLEQVVYKILTPIRKVAEYIDEKEYKKKEGIREAGRNMTIDEAVDISIELILEKLIKWEDDIELTVAEWCDVDYFTTTTFKWLLRNLPDDYDKNKKYKMLRSYIYKNEKYGQEALEINREFAEAIYNKIKDYKDLKVEWIVDKEKYGYFRSRNYEKTLVIGLKED